MSAFSAVLFVSAVASWDCSIGGFSKNLPANATILEATKVPENGTYGEGAIDLEFPTLGVGLPQLCAVKVLVYSSSESHYRFGLFLPDQWNQRYLATGNGGFGGGIDWAGMGTYTRYGFAAMSTDTGHNASTGDATWAINNTESQTDWGYRAMHGSIVLSKQLTDAYYGSDHKYAYYSGCSTGGRQGMKEVQMFPNDFDGVLAGAPAWWTTHLQTWTLWVGLYNLPVDSPGHVPESLMTTIVHDEILRQCDPQDGVKDNVISRPYSCDFRLETIECGPGANTSTCLTSAQIATLRKLYSPWVDTNQTFVFPGYAPGSELQNGAVFVDSAPPSPLGTSWVGSFLYNSANYNYQDFSYATVQLADAINPGNANANDSDISAFYAKGGKLMSYHGYADGLIPTGSSLYLYDLYDQAMRAKGIKLDDFYRLFMVPGMQHCAQSVQNAPWVIAGDGQALNTTSYSVPGFMDADHDALLSLMRWVEQDIAPQSLIATKFANDSANGAVVRQRPLCPYPQVAELVNAAQPDEASSWSCSYLY